MHDSLFVLARQDAARDRRVGMGFWLNPDNERELRKTHLKDVQQFAGRAVGEEDFHIRGMMVANSQRDYYYSRFSKDALQESAELLPGAPAMYGHNYGTQPVGRIFHARVTRVEDPNLHARDQNWLEALYYVPRDAEGDAHVKRVDLGIYREVSFGWRCLGQECNVCGDSIYRCPHIPGDIYEKKGFAEYEFSGITAALEVSHVFRGGQKDTSTFVPDASADSGADPVSAAAMRAFVPGTRDVDPAQLIIAKRHNGSLLRGKLHEDMTLERWLAGDEGQRAVGMGAYFFGMPGERGNTQSVRVNADRFTSKAAAQRWVRDHDFRADKVAERDGVYSFTQQNEARFSSDGWRSIRLDNGIEARVGKPAAPQTVSGAASARTNGTVSLEDWLAGSSA